MKRAKMLVLFFAVSSVLVVGFTNCGKFEMSAGISGASVPLAGGLDEKSQQAIGNAQDLAQHLQDSAVSAHRSLASDESALAAELDTALKTITQLEAEISLDTTKLQQYKGDIESWRGMLSTSQAARSEAVKAHLQALYQNRDEHTKKVAELVQQIESAGPLSDEQLLQIRDSMQKIQKDAETKLAEILNQANSLRQQQLTALTKILESLSIFAASVRG